MNFLTMQTALELGYDHSFTIEEDGKMWHGTDQNRKYLTASEIKVITDKTAQAEIGRAAAKAALLVKLGITADEAALLITA